MRVNFYIFLRNKLHFWHYYTVQNRVVKNAIMNLISIEVEKFGSLLVFRCNAEKLVTTHPSKSID